MKWLFDTIIGVVFCGASQINQRGTLTFPGGSKPEVSGCSNVCFFVGVVGVVVQCTLSNLVERFSLLQIDPEEKISKFGKIRLTSEIQNPSFSFFVQRINIICDEA